MNAIEARNNSYNVERDRGATYVALCDVTSHGSIVVHADDEVTLVSVLNAGFNGWLGTFTTRDGAHVHASLGMFYRP